MACTGLEGVAFGSSAGVTAGALLLPLSAGLGYSFATVCLKRSITAGVPGGWINVLCNTVMGICFQILWFFPGSLPPDVSLLPAVACGILFFLGQIFTFRAISAGDVSVATPLLGTKVRLVALLSFALLGQRLPASWWLASCLASAGIGLISYTRGGDHRSVFATAGWSLSAASVFALTDVRVQSWVPRVGYTRFAPIMFGTAGLASLVYIPGLSGTCGVFFRSAASAFPWLFSGTLLLALQALGMYSAIGLYGNATVTNIIYGSRCLWSVLLVWVLGSLSLFGECDGQPNAFPVYLRRFFGALLLFAAMALVLGGANR